ncbi:Eco47II family restriction endonuclease [Canibacter sp. lx-45]|uniref:Eco47II family restriction endonuclease n=1 Tax=Canibacter zhuwentaonis TaxID=2837491 RepID=UPI001BDBC76C|nr:Eco47II family restriction endonuclease [Canibacter zhuwentaonis]MBT1035083.1 Eco47II family restriction endonuclease [Canibacter zhuwentaonis]
MKTYSYGIDFFDDETLESEVEKIFTSLDRAIKSNPHKNIMDPFLAIFEATYNKISIEEWLDMETSRQFNKTLSNAIGAFHQNLLGALPGWTSTGRSGGVIDIVHKEEFGVTGRPAIGEVKNKFNTLNASGKQTLYDNFQDALKWNYKGYNCYLVEVIQKTPKPQHPWKVANRGEREDIRLISASEVYKISTGDDQAFSKFFTAVNELLLKKYQLPSNEQAQRLFKRAFGSAGMPENATG